MKKTIKGLAAVLAVMVLIGLTDCPKCEHIICQCGLMDAYATEAEETVEIAAEEEAEDQEEVIEEISVEGLIAEVCSDNGFTDEIPMVLAIARLETGHFTSDAYVYGNNVGGISVDEVPIEYEDLETGVTEFVELLVDDYFMLGLTTVEQIGEKYCPKNKEHWISTVNQLMKEGETHDR